MSFLCSPPNLWVCRIISASLILAPPAGKSVPALHPSPGFLQLKSLCMTSKAMCVPCSSFPPPRWGFGQQRCKHHALEHSLGRPISASSGRKAEVSLGTCSDTVPACGLGNPLLSLVPCILLPFPLEPTFIFSPAFSHHVLQSCGDRIRLQIDSSLA